MIILQKNALKFANFLLFYVKNGKLHNNATHFSERNCPEEFLQKNHNQMKNKLSIYK